MAYEWILGDFMTGEIVRANGLPVAGGQSVNIDILGEGDAEVPVVLNELAPNERNNWRTLFRDNLRFIALVDYDKEWDELDAVAFAGMISKNRNPIQDGILRVLGFELNQWLKMRQVGNAWDVITNPEASQRWEGGNWTTVITKIVKHAFSMEGIPENAPHPPQILGTLPEEVAGTNFAKEVFLSETRTIFDVLEELRDEDTDGNTEWRFRPRWANDSKNRIVWDLIVSPTPRGGGAGEEHYNLFLAESDADKFSDYSTEIDGSDSYSKVWAQSKQGENKAGADLTPKWVDRSEFPLLIERFVNPGVELTKEEMDRFLAERIRYAARSEETVAFSVEEEFELYKWSSRLGSMLNIVGIPDTISADHGALVRLVGYSFVPNEGTIELKVMTPQARYTRLPHNGGDYTPINDENIYEDPVRPPGGAPGWVDGPAWGEPPASPVIEGWQAGVAESVDEWLVHFLVRPVSNADSYMIRYKHSGDDEWRFTNVQTHSTLISIAALDGWTVTLAARAFNKNGGSPWVEKEVVMNTQPPDLPEITRAEMLEKKAIFEFREVPDAFQYEAQMRINEGPWLLTETQFPGQPIYSREIDYVRSVEFRVRAIGNNLVTSDWNAVKIPKGQPRITELEYWEKGWRFKFEDEYSQNVDSYDFGLIRTEGDFIGQVSTFIEAGEFVEHFSEAALYYGAEGLEGSFMPDGKFSGYSRGEWPVWVPTVSLVVRARHGGTVGEWSEPKTISFDNSRYFVRAQVFLDEQDRSFYLTRRLAQPSFPYTKIVEYHLGDRIWQPASKAGAGWDFQDRVFFETPVGSAVENEINRVYFRVRTLRDGEVGPWQFITGPEPWSEVYDDSIAPAINDIPITMEGAGYFPAPQITGAETTANGVRFMFSEVENAERYEARIIIDGEGDEDDWDITVDDAAPNVPFGVNAEPGTRITLIVKAQGQDREGLWRPFIMTVGENPIPIN